MTIFVERWLTYKKKFKLLVVPFPDVPVEDVAAAMKPLVVDQVQFLPLATAGAGPKTAAKSIAGHLGPLTRPFQHEIEKRVYKELRKDVSDAERSDLWNVLEQVGTGSPDDQARLLARALLNMNGRVGEERLECLGDVVDELSALDGAKLRRIVAYIMPFCWVDPTQAASLTCIAAGVHESRAVVWARAWMLSERMYLRRAYGHALGAKLAPLSPDPSAEEVLGLVRDNRRKGWQVFVLLSLAAFDPTRSESLEDVLAEWPGVTFFMYVQGVDETARQALGQVLSAAGGVRQIPLDPEEEKSAVIALSQYFSHVELSDWTACL
jgi:hypothetical protein